MLTLAMFCAALIGFGLAGTTAARAEPTGNNNENGKCTAYFNGESKDEGSGSDDLREDAAAYDEATFPAEGGTDLDEDGDTDNDDFENLTDATGVWGERHESSDVYEYCTRDGDDRIQGQPEHNGAYDCEEPDAGLGRDFDADGEIECFPNDGAEHPYYEIVGYDEDGNPILEPWDSADEGEEQDNADTGNDHPSRKGGGNG